MLHETRITTTTHTYTCQNYVKHDSFVMGIQYSTIIIRTLMPQADTTLGEEIVEFQYTIWCWLSYKVTPWNYKYGWRWTPVKSPFMMALWDERGLAVWLMV